MKPTHYTLGAAAALAVVLTLGAAGPAFAQKSGKTAKVPDGWAYEIKNGRRVPKSNRVQAGDGSWKEQRKDDNCVTVREQTPTGEYREGRKCD